MAGCKSSVVKSDQNNHEQTGIQENTRQETAGNVEDSEDEIETPVAARVIVAEDVLNMRKSPSESAEVIGKVFRGSVYEVLSEKVSDENEEQTWYQILINGQEGWIAGWFCELTDDDLIDYNSRMDQVEIDINAYYLLGHVLDFDALVDWQDYQVSYEGKDGLEPVDKKLTLATAGQLVIELRDMLGRSRRLEWPILLGQEDRYMKALYESMSFESAIIAFEKDVDLTYDETAEAFITIKDGNLMGWYKAKYKGQTVYYYNENIFHTNSSINFARFHFKLHRPCLRTSFM